MNSEYSALFTPWKIGNVEIKNRIVLCPMGGTSLFGWMEPNHFDKEAANFFLERAKNNVGLIIPGIAPLKDTIGNRWLYQNKKMFKDLKVFMDELHKTGAKLFVQLTAGFGRSFAITDPLAKLYNTPLRTLIKPVVDLSYLCASPSELPSRWADNVNCRALTKKEIDEIVEAFAKTAALCKEAGVDGVEIHAVHEGYLIDQFTMKYTNKRTDEYGGSFENRYRFPVEIVKRVKAVCGKDFPVSLRYSVLSKTKDFCYGALPGEEGYTEVGRDMEESEKAAKYLQDAGYDMLDADNGTYDSWYWCHPPAYMPQNCNLDDVAHIRKFIDIPVVCAGRMEPDVAAKAIEDGKIDAMGVARQFLADPEWITKLMNNKLEDILPCICCHNGCFNMAHYKGHANDQDFGDSAHMARCALNPQTMQSKKYKIVKAAKSKNIAVIGGGIGGMEAARVLALRGHKVTIYEKSDKLGGIFIAAAAPSYKEKDRDLIEWYKREIAKLPITVKLGTEVKDVNSLGADEVIIATGSKARKIPVKGAELAMDATEFLLGEKAVGDTVVIVGGGLTGCEIAYDLYLHGKKPIIVEMKDDLVAVKGVCLANSSFLRDFFKTNKVPVYLETKLGEVLPDGIMATDKNGKSFKIEADSVILSVGYIPTPLAAEGKNIHVIGDAEKIGNLRTVIWGAWDVAMKL